MYTLELEEQCSLGMREASFKQRLFMCSLLFLSISFLSIAVVVVVVAVPVPVPVPVVVLLLPLLLLLLLDLLPVPPLLLFFLLVFISPTAQPLPARADQVLTVTVRQIWATRTAKVVRLKMANNLSEL